MISGTISGSLISDFPISGKYVMSYAISRKNTRYRTRYRVKTRHQGRYRTRYCKNIYPQLGPKPFLGIRDVGTDIAYVRDIAYKIPDIGTDITVYP